MKRLLIATLALSTLVACSNDSESELVEDDTSVEEVTNDTESEVSEDLSDKTYEEILEGSELGQSKKESEEAYQEALEAFDSEDETENPLTLSDIVDGKSKELEEATEKSDAYAEVYKPVRLSGEDSIVHNEGDVVTAIGSIEYFPGPNSHIKVHYTVKNNSSETVPLILLDTVLVTDEGVQLDSDRIESDYPEPELRPTVEDTGYIYFPTDDIPSIDESTDVTVYVPTVGYNHDEWTYNTAED